MSDLVAWTQWEELTGPAGVTMLHPGNTPDPMDAADQLTFYVPRYLGGTASLEIIPSLHRVEVVQLPTAGYEDALPYANPPVTLCNARGVHDASTAELALGMMIASQRELPGFQRAQERRDWDQHMTRSLSDARVGIVGYGSIGRHLHRMLEPFTTTVTGFTRSGQDGTTALAELDRCLPDLDIVVLLVPANPDSIGLFDAQRIARMRPDSLLVNVSRGVVVETDALLEALVNGRIRAAVDVTDPEPLPPDHALWSTPNCLITPHIGGFSTAFEPRMKRLVQNQLERLVADQPVANVISQSSDNIPDHEEK